VVQAEGGWSASKSSRPMQNEAAQGAAEVVDHQGDARVVPQVQVGG